jgi:hypothetical protein
MGFWRGIFSPMNGSVVKATPAGLEFLMQKRPRAFNELKGIR